jgi:hypothetical protein
MSNRSVRRSKQVNQEQNSDLIRALRGESEFFVEEADVVVGGKVAILEDIATEETIHTNEDCIRDIADDSSFNATSISSIDDMMERAKYIPLRLSYEERKSLRLVNAAINVSDYTSSVDIEFKTASKRRHIQLQNICGFLSGVISAWSYEDGQQVLQDRNFADYETFLQVSLYSSNVWCLLC